MTRCYSSRRVSVTEGHLEPISVRTRHAIVALCLSRSTAASELPLRRHDTKHLRIGDNLCPNLPRSVAACVYVCVCRNGITFIVLNLGDRPRLLIHIK
jgi:hypothetical protein